MLNFITKMIIEISLRKNDDVRVSLRILKDKMTQNLEKGLDQAHRNLGLD